MHVLLHHNLYTKNWKGAASVIKFLYDCFFFLIQLLPARNWSGNFFISLFLFIIFFCFSFIFIGFCLHLMLSTNKQTCKVKSRKRDIGPPCFYATTIASDHLRQPLQLPFHATPPTVHSDFSFMLSITTIFVSCHYDLRSRDITLNRLYTWITNTWTATATNYHCTTVLIRHSYSPQS